MQRRYLEFLRSAQQAMIYCQVKPDDKVVVFSDSGRNPALVEAFYSAAVAAGAEAVLVTTPTAPRALVDPPAPAVRAMAAADVVFDLATHPWLYTQATNTILNAGTRMLQVLVGDDTVIARPPSELIARREGAARKILEGCQTFRVTSSYGTDISMARGDRPIHTQGGFVDRPGDWDSLGVHLAAFAPLEDQADGKLALFGTMYLPSKHLFITETPIQTVVEGGRMTHIETDHREAKLFADWMKSWDDPNSYVIAHTGFGIDERAVLEPFDPGEWESYLAGVNIAFGGNNIPQLGGQTACKSHMDAVLLNVDVAVDGRQITEAGRFVPGLGLDA
jgi:leucyl aminopeptidase (aminopeptidase T)